MTNFFGNKKRLFTDHAHCRDMGNKHHHHHHHDGDVAADDAAMRRAEKVIEGKIHFKVDDPRFLEMTKWPVMLLDTTGSMNEPCSNGGTLARKDLVYQCVGVLCDMLAGMDDAETQPPGWRRGCPAITFNGIEKGVYRGFLHADNLQPEWATIKFHGGTHIMDGWRTMLSTYQNHFTEFPQDQWPLLLCLIITDGELLDGHEFEQHLKHVHGRAFVEIAVVGYGEDHDRALRHYRHISHHHHHVRVTSFTGETDPRAIAVALLGAVDPKLLNM